MHPARRHRAARRDQAVRHPGGGIYTALRDLDLTVAPGEFCAVVGPTGCGKSTTLTLVSGLERPSTGDGQVDGRAGLAASPPASASCSRPTRSFPWKTCSTTSPPARASAASAEAEAHEAARDWLRRVGLAGFEDRYPHQLSGGMRKRVALAQSLINEPRILLMDEPFCALDVQTRAIMSDELLSLWDLTRPAVVFVTHDLEEAIALADKVVVLTAGPAHGQGDLPDRPAPAARGAGDPLRPAIRRAVPRDLGSAARRGRDGLRPHDRGRRPRCRHERPSRPDRPARGGRRGAGAAARRSAAPPAAPPRRRSPGRGWRSSSSSLGGWELAVRDRHHRPVLLRPAVSGIVDQLHDLGHRRHARRARWASRSWSPWRRRSSASSSASPSASSAASRSAGSGSWPTCSARSSRSLNSIPRIVLGSLFVARLRPRAESKVAARRRAGVLRRLLQRLPGHPRGRPQPHRQRPHPRRLRGRSPARSSCPSAFTWILASLHVSFGFALIGAIVGEFLGADKGLGLLISSAQGTFDANGVWAAMVIIAVVALIAEGSSPRWRSACCAGARRSQAGRRRPAL